MQGQPKFRVIRLPRFPGRVAAALQRRLFDTEDEMASSLKLREEAYRLADALLDEFDDLAEQRRMLRVALWSLETRMAARRAWEQPPRAPRRQPLLHAEGAVL